MDRQNDGDGIKPLEGRVAWLILLVVVSVCVVCCVLCSNRRPDDCTFFSGRNFIQFCNNWCSYFDTTDGYLLSEIYFNRWPDDCTFFSGRNFFLVVI